MQYNKQIKNYTKTTNTIFVGSTQLRTKFLRESYNTEYRTRDIAFYPVIY